VTDEPEMDDTEDSVLTRLTDVSGLSVGRSAIADDTAAWDIGTHVQAFDRSDLAHPRGHL
jgi:hypothetical protein